MDAAALRRWRPTSILLFVLGMIGFIAGLYTGSASIFTGSALVAFAALAFFSSPRGFSFRGLSAEPLRLGRRGYSFSPAQLRCSRWCINSASCSCDGRP